MDMNNSKQYYASAKESKRLIYKQVLIIYGPSKSIHLILERKYHVSQIFREIFKKELQQKCTKKTWLEMVLKNIRKECFPFLSQNT